LNQAINIANLLRGGEFKFESPEDEQIRAQQEYKRYQEQISAVNR
jgi:hypothetical protein